MWHFSLYSLFSPFSMTLSSSNRLLPKEVPWPFRFPWYRTQVTKASEKKNAAPVPLWRGFFLQLEAWQPAPHGLLHPVYLCQEWELCLLWALWTFWSWLFPLARPYFSPWGLWTWSVPSPPSCRGCRCQERCYSSEAHLLAQVSSWSGGTRLDWLSDAAPLHVWWCPWSRFSGPGATVPRNWW